MIIECYSGDWIKSPEEHKASCWQTTESINYALEYLITIAKKIAIFLGGKKSNQNWEMREGKKFKHRNKIIQSLFTLGVVVSSVF